ncbi:MAG: hypothetical protein J5938_06735 [Clostridia bacterium]|nr:hypothetical protein [Clostridia bacterium]
MSTRRWICFLGLLLLSFLLICACADGPKDPSAGLDATGQPSGTAPDPDHEHVYEKDESLSTPILTVSVCSCGDVRSELFVQPIIKDDYSPNWNASWNKKVLPWEEIREGGRYDDVYIGKEAFGETWMYHNYTFPELLGTNLYTDTQLEMLASSMQQRSDWCEENGMTFYFLICPSKTVIYPEYLPDGMGLKPAEQNRFDQVVGYLAEHTTVRVIDGRKGILAAKEAEPDRLLYYPLDSHWNENGGYAEYVQVMNEFRKDYPNIVLHEIDEYRIDSFESYFKDNTYYMGWYDTFKTSGPVYTLKDGKIGRCTWAGRKTLGGQFDQAYLERGGFSDGTLNAKFVNEYQPDAPSVYVINDSFFIAMTRFFRDSFSSFSRHWTNDFSCSDILAEHPNIVLYQVIEDTLSDAFKQAPLG